MNSNHTSKEPEASAPPTVDPAVQAEIDRARARIQSVNEALASKGKLLLEVELSTPEEADQILNWLYLKGDGRPMKANLTRIHWDRTTVSEKTMKAIDNLIDAIRNP